MALRRLPRVPGWRVPDSFVETSCQLGERLGENVEFSSEPDVIQIEDATLSMASAALGANAPGVLRGGRKDGLFKCLTGRGMRCIQCSKVFRA